MSHTETPTPSETPAQSPGQTATPTPEQSPAEATEKSPAEKPAEEAKEDEPEAKEEEKAEDPAEAESDTDGVVVPAALPVGASNKEAAFVASQAKGVDEIDSDLEQMTKWHGIFMAYLSAKRAPLLLKLQHLHITSNDGLLGLKQTNLLLEQLIDKYQRMLQGTQKSTQLYGKPLHTSPNTLPVITASGQGDPSILSLAALVSNFYSYTEDYQMAIDKLQELKTSLEAFTTQPVFKPSYNAIKGVQAKEVDANKALEAHSKVVQYYKINKSNIEYLGSKKRTNVTVSRDQYVASIAALYKTDVQMKEAINANIAEAVAPEHARRDAVQNVLLEVSKLMLLMNTNNTARLNETIAKQQYAPTQAKTYNDHVQSLSHRPTLVEAARDTTVAQDQPDKESQHFIKVNPSIPSPVPSVLTKSSTMKLFIDVPEDATMSVLEQNLHKAEKPEDFPADATTLKTCSDAKNYGTFSDKPAQLVYTKTHQIQMYLTKDADKANADAPSGEGAPKLQINPEPEWVLDGSIVVATADAKKPNIVTLLEHSKGFFSISRKATVVFSSASSAEEWIEFVNDNNTIDASKE